MKLLLERVNCIKSFFNKSFTPSRMAEDMVNQMSSWNDAEVREWLLALLYGLKREHTVIKDFRRKSGCENQYSLTLHDFHYIETPDKKVAKGAVVRDKFKRIVLNNREAQFNLIKKLLNQVVCDFGYKDKDDLLALCGASQVLDVPLKKYPTLIKIIGDKYELEKGYCIYEKVSH